MILSQSVKIERRADSRDCVASSITASVVIADPCLSSIGFLVRGKQTVVNLTCNRACNLVIDSLGALWLRLMCLHVRIRHHRSMSALGIRRASNYSANIVWWASHILALAVTMPNFVWSYESSCLLAINTLLLYLVDEARVQVHTHSLSCINLIADLGDLFACKRHLLLVLIVWGADSTVSVVLRFIECADWGCEDRLIVIVVLWMAWAWDSYLRLSLSKLLNYGVHIKFYDAYFRIW